MTTQDLVNGASLVFGALGVILAVVFYFRGKREMVPVMEIESEATIAEAALGEPVEVQVLFRGKPVTNVHVLKVTLRNVGRQPILQGSVSPATPFGVSFEPEAQILEANVVSDSRKDLAATVITNSDIGLAMFGFNFLDAGDWITLQILYTAPCRKYHCQGVAIGAKPLRVPGVDTATFGRRANSVMSILTAVSFAIYAFTGGGKRPWWVLWVFAALSLSMTTISVLMELDKPRKSRS